MSCKSDKARVCLSDLQVSREIFPVSESQCGLIGIQATPAMSTSRISILSLMSKWFFIPNIFSLCVFAFQLRLCRKRLTWSNGYLEVIFHALDVISIIFATSYVEDKNRRSHGRHIVCFGCVHVWPEVRKSSNKNQNQLKWYIASFDWAINPLLSAIKSMAVLIRNHTQYR